MPEFTLPLRYEHPVRLSIGSPDGSPADALVHVVADPKLTNAELTLRGRRQDDLARLKLAPGRLEDSALDVHVHSATTWTGASTRDDLLVVARIPPFSSVQVALRDSRVELVGELDHVDVHTHSGAVTTSHAFRTGDVHSHSGALTFASVPGSLAAYTDTGQLTVAGVTGNGRLETGSGAITVEHADPAGHLRLESATGAITCTAANRAALDRITARSAGPVNRGLHEGRPAGRRQHQRALDDAPRVRGAHPTRDGRTP